MDKVIDWMIATLAAAIMACVIYLGGYYPEAVQTACLYGGAFIVLVCMYMGAKRTDVYRNRAHHGDHGVSMYCYKDEHTHN